MAEPDKTADAEDERGMLPPLAGQPTGTAWPVPQAQRSPFVRILLALTTSGALLGVAAVVAAAAMIPPVGARRAAREAAEREVRAQMAADEAPVATSYASQRRWTDFWRESFGVVIATNRRLLYVGAPPTPMLRPREDGPPELLVESYPYDASFIIEPRSVFFGFGRGLALKTPGGKVEFLVGSREWTSALAVANAAQLARAATHEELEQAEDARLAPPRPAVYVPYVVKRGENLTVLARRFRTSTDVLRQLNKLQTDEIRAGQRLRVPQVEQRDSVADSVSGRL